MTLKNTLLALGAAITFAAGAQQTVHDRFSCAPSGVAVGGFDVVSYFAPGGPTRGAPEFSVSIEGLTYLFSSAENRDRFLAAPRDYLPEYGGWCAASLAYGSLRCPDFANFKIENERLLLFEITGFTNGRILWDTDPAGHRRRADENFSLLATR
jgi:YHS domain-containing protein